MVLDESLYTFYLFIDLSMSLQYLEQGPFVESDPCGDTIRVLMDQILDLV